MTDEKARKDFGRKEYEYLCDIQEAIEEIETHPRFAEGKKHGRKINITEDGAIFK